MPAVDHNECKQYSMTLFQEYNKGLLCVTHITFAYSRSSRGSFTIKFLKLRGFFTYPQV